MAAMSVHLLKAFSFIILVLLEIFTAKGGFIPSIFSSFFSKALLSFASMTGIPS